MAGPEEEDKEKFHSVVSRVNDIILVPNVIPNLIGNEEDMIGESRVPAFEMSHQS